MFCPEAVRLAVLQAVGLALYVKLAVVEIVVSAFYVGLKLSDVNFVARVKTRDA